MMTKYIPLSDYAKHMQIQKGDTIFISSDAKTMLLDALENESDMNLNLFIDGLLQAVGNEGTVVFPTYNWDFCKGKTFSYLKTKCKTGALGDIALKRSDFLRTKHPIYSFAVWGKYSDKLLALENKDSFGNNSPFQFFHENNVINYVIDVPLNHCFTFAHYVEQASGVADYRYIKEFKAEYIDDLGESTMRTYTMFVRDLDRDVVSLVDPIEGDLIKAGAESKFTINNSSMKRIEMGKAFSVLMDDMINNNGKKLCRYKGQK